MKLNLLPEHESALNKFTEKLRALNPDLEPASNRLIGALVVYLERSKDEAMLRGIANALIPEKVRLKRKLERIERISEHLDEEALSKIEMRISKQLKSEATIPEKSLETC